MSTSVSMWLGLLFLGLSIAAVLLQAWLWGPKYWDPVAKKSLAPRRWVRLHRAVGWAYAGIYVVMMTEMVPRLWEYQVELPARTVVHATVAIVIGAVLCTKIVILRFFRHFEEAMPALGLVIVVCTVVLAAFSIPFAARARGSDAAFTDENRARVERVLGRLELGGSHTAADLSSIDALERGREVVMQRCSGCHDLRTVISKPRTGSGWLSVARRMQDKPTLAEPLTDDEVLLATAYLVAITPLLRDDVMRAEAEALERDEAANSVGEGLSADAAEAERPDAAENGAALAGADGGAAPDAGVEAAAGSPDAGVAVDAGRRPRPRVRRDSGVHDAGLASASAVEDEPVVTMAAPTLRYSASLARDILDRRCTDCHGLEDLETYGGGDRAAWSGLVQRMVRRGAELEAPEARVLVQYLAATYPPPS